MQQHEALPVLSLGKGAIALPHSSGQETKVRKQYTALTGLRGPIALIHSSGREVNEAKDRMAGVV